MNSRLIMTVVMMAVVVVAVSFSHAADPTAKPQSKQDLMMEAMLKFGPPGPEHKNLEPLVGTWTAKMKMWMDPSQPAIESDGVLTRKAVLGGRFVQEDYTGNVMGQSYQGVGTMGFDRAKKTYLSNWMDNMSTAVMDSKGQYDGAAKTWTFGCEETCPLTNEPVKSRHTLQIVNSNEQKMTMYRKTGNEPEMKCMELLLTRKQ